MSLLLYRLGHFCVRHRRTVIGFWIALVIALGVVSRVVGNETSDNLTLPGTDSTHRDEPARREAAEGEERHRPDRPRHRLGAARLEPEHEGRQRTTKSLSNADGVEKAVTPLSDKGSDQLSKDGQTGYVSLTLSIGQGELEEEEAQVILDAAQPAVDAGWEVSAGGYLGQELSKPSTHSSEAIGIAAAVIILLFAFGTAVAMSLPIFTAIASVVCGLSLIYILSNLTTVSTVAPTLGTMIGLGVGIDYSLFIVTRYRELLAAGVDPPEAVARSTASSGSAVAFAGGTVVIALCSLFFAGIPLVSALGYSAAVVVVIAVGAALTMLPALLGILGRRVNSLPVPFGRHSEGKDDHPHGWERWARMVAKHHWIALITAVAVLVVLALPTFDLKLGQEDVGVLPDSTTARQSYDAINSEFDKGENGPLLVAVKLKPPAHNDQKKLNQLNDQVAQQQQQTENAVNQQAQQIYNQLIAEGVPPDQAQTEAQQQAEAQAPQPSQSQQQQTDQQKSFLQSTASDPRLVKLENKIGKANNVADVSEAKVSSDGEAAVFSVLTATAPSSYATQNVVNDLRDKVIPKATKGSGLTAYVGGTTAGYIDLADKISDKLVLVIAIVVGLSFLLLMIAFRSVLVPLTAGIMNLLSVAAAYGVLTAIFEKGWGDELIGLAHPIPVESFVPLLMFAILFGLSMDYQVFLVSRIHEHFTETNDNRESVILGLATSARVITSAALIMVSVFASFILNGDPTVKQFGVGLAVAIAVDATIVRCLLVPSVMVLFGKANWWMPPGSTGSCRRSGSRARSRCRRSRPPKQHFLEGLPL